MGDGEEESEEEEPAASSAAPTQELSREERRELAKKKKAAAAARAKNGANGEGDEEEEDDDPLLTNPNRAAGKRLAIADLGAPRELTRRERCVILFCFSLRCCMVKLPTIGSRRRRRRPKNGTGR